MKSSIDYSYAIALICISLFLPIFLNCNNGNRGIDSEVINEYKNFQLPVYSTANNINEKFSKRLLQKWVKYKIEMHYPAEKAISYYKKQLDARQFKLIDDHKKCDWRTFTDGTIKGEPDITLCKLSWASSDKKKRADLVLRYYWWKKENRVVLNSNKDLEIEFMVQPFYEDIKGYYKKGTLGWEPVRP